MIWQTLANLTKILPGEESHQLAVGALSVGLHPRYNPVKLPTMVGGLYFANPVGLAAGFDKNASAIS